MQYIRTLESNSAHVSGSERSIPRPREFGGDEADSTFRTNRVSKKKSRDLGNLLKQELQLDEHKVPIEELYGRYGCLPKRVRDSCFQC